LFSVPVQVIALLKAEYRPRVAAVSLTQKNTKNPRDLDL